MSITAEKFKDVYNLLITDSFLKKEALGGEIPFFIVPYEADRELSVRKEIKALKNKLENKGIPILELNLYSIICEIIENKGGMEKKFELERSLSKAKFMRNLQSSLNIKKVVLPFIAKKIDEYPEAKIYFLTGVGLVYPYIRSHLILNNLQTIAKDAPTVMFYPGNFDGASLRLFEKLNNKNYYRAFNILELKVKS